MKELVTKIKNNQLNLLALLCLPFLVACSGASDMAVSQIQQAQDQHKLEQGQDAVLKAEKALLKADEEMDKFQKSAKQIEQLQSQSERTIVKSTGVLDELSNVIGRVTEKGVKKMVDAFESLEEQKVALEERIEEVTDESVRVQLQASLDRIDDMLHQVARGLDMVRTQLSNLNTGFLSKLFSKLTKFKNLILNSSFGWIVTVVDIILGGKITAFLDKLNFNTLLTGDALNLIPDRIDQYL